MECTDAFGGSCMRGNDGTPCLIVKDRAKHRNTHMNEENECDQIADADTVERPIEKRQWRRSAT